MGAKHVSRLKSRTRLSGIVLVLGLLAGATANSEERTHSFTITTEMRVQMVLSLVENAITQPSDFNLALLESTIDQPERSSAMSGLRRVAASTAFSSFSLSSANQSSAISIDTRRIHKIGDAYTAKLYLSVPIDEGVELDSFTVDIVQKGPTFVIKGLSSVATTLSKIIDRANQADRRDTRIALQSAEMEITDYTSAHMLQPSPFYGSHSVLSKTTSASLLDGIQAFSRPHGICALVTKDPGYAPGNYEMLYCTDVNWDRIIMAGNPTVSSVDPYLVARLSHGNGNSQVSRPSAIDFAGYNMLVADAYNNRVLVYNIGNTNANLYFVHSLAASWFNDVVDVAGSWILNRDNTTEKWAEVAVLSKGINRIDIFDFGTWNLKKVFQPTDFGATPLKGPTSICFRRNLVDGFSSQILYVCDNGNKRIVARGYGAIPPFLASTPAGMFPSNANLTSVETDNLGYVYVLDSYNSKVYYISPTLGELIGVWGTKGTSSSQLWYPTSLDHTTGWAEGVSQNDPREPMNLGDVAIAESWGTNSGMKTFVQDFDVLNKQLTYHSGPSSQRYDYVEFTWHQTGSTTGLLNIYDSLGIGPDTTIFINLAWPGTRSARCYFDKPPDSSFLTNRYYAELYLQGAYNESHIVNTSASVHFTRSFPPAYDGGRVWVENYGIRDPQTGLEADTVYGYKWYLYWSHPVDREETYTDIDNQFRAIQSLDPIFKLETFGQYYTNSTLPNVHQDSIFVMFRPTTQTTYNGQNVALVATKYGIINASTNAYDQLVPCPNPYSSDSCLLPGATNSPAEVCWNCRKFYRPFKCKVPGQTCPSPPPPPPACPFLFVWTGDNYRFVNNILPQAEVVPSVFQTDWQVLPEQTLEDSGQIRLRISEEERELSTFDKLALYAVDLPDSLGDISITNLYELANPNDSSIVPLSAITNLDIDVLDAIIAPDSQFFTANDSGFIDIEYDLGSMITSKDGTGSLAQGSSPGGGQLPPPPKNMGKLSAFGDSLDPNIYVLSVDTGTGTYFEVARIAPRLTQATEIIRLSDYVRSRSLKLRVAWNHRASIDYLPYVNYEVPIATVTPLTIVSATQSTTGDITSEVGVSDSVTVSLSPWEAIDLRFDAGTPPQVGFVRRYVFEAVGTYERIPSEEEPPDDSTENNSGFSFEQSYPNPANPSTTFRFSIPASSHVELSLFNILGQRVATVVDDIRQAGTYMVNWDGKVTGGKTASTGVYFAKLNAGSYSATKKVVIVK